MTKKPSVKNREWEKERRDRLNAAMDKLGRLLPQFDHNTPLSKIEIVQRAIEIVEELQRQIRDLLAGSNSSILKSQQDLEHGLKSMHLRNETLGALLKKAKITVPPFTPPKAIGCILPATTATDPIGTVGENNCNEINVMAVGRPPKHSQLIGAKAAKAAEQAASKSTTIGTQTMDIPPANLIRIPILQSSGPLMLIKHAISSSSGKSVVQRYVRPRSVAGKVAIPALKRRNVRPKIRHKRNRKKKPKSDKVEGKSAVSESGVGQKRSVSADETGVSEPKRVKVTEKSDEANAEPLNQVNVPIDTPLQPPVPPENPTSPPPPQSSDHLDFDPSYPQPAALARPVDLSQDILESLHETNHESLSPTAAFLLSFPVVATGSGCARGPDEAPDHPEATPTDGSGVADGQHSILENITSLLTTKDYERFVEDVAKTEQNLSGMVGGSGKKVMEQKAVATNEEMASSKSTYDMDKAFGYPTYSKQVDSCLKPQKLDYHHDAYAACTLFTFSLTSTTNTASVATKSTVVTPSKALGFYDSLSNIGSSSTRTACTTSAGAAYVPNLYSNALSLASSSTTSHKPLEPSYSMEAQPFTFSLTSTTTSSAVYCSTTASNTAHKSLPPPLPPPQTNFNIADTILQPQSSSNFSQPATAYNPFAFDNIPVLPATPAQVVDVPQFTFSLTSSKQTPTKTATTTTNSSSFSMYNFFGDASTSKPTHGGGTLSTLPFSVCSAVTPKPTVTQSLSTVQQDVSANTAETVAPKTHSSAEKYKSTSRGQSTTKAHVNWMTSTHHTSSNTHHHSHSNLPTHHPVDFNPTIPPSHEYTPAYYPTPKPDLSYVPPPPLPPHPVPLPPPPQLSAPPVPHALADDSFAWSPNKLLDASSGVLPTLHGDLALNTFGVCVRPHLSTIASTKRSAVEKNTVFSVSHLVDQQRSKSSTAGGRNAQKAKDSNKMSTAAVGTKSCGGGHQQQLQPQQQQQHNHHQYHQYTSSTAAVQKTASSSAAISNTYSTEALLSTSSSGQCRSAAASTSTKRAPKYAYTQDCYGNNTSVSDIYVPSVGDNAYNYYPSNYLTGGQHQTGRTNLDQSFHHHHHAPTHPTTTVHSESDYLGANMPSTLATATEVPQKGVARSSGYLGNHQQQQQQQQHHPHQQPQSSGTISHAYPFNNNSNNTSSSNSTTAEKHSAYTNNYKCIGDISTATTATNPPRRSHHQQHAAITTSDPMHNYFPAIPPVPPLPVPYHQQTSSSFGQPQLQSHHYNHPHHPHVGYGTAGSFGQYAVNSSASTTTGINNNSSSSGLVSNFNLSTICPEINNDDNGSGGGNNAKTAVMNW